MSAEDARKTRRAKPLMSVAVHGLVLPLRVEERPTTGSPKADRMIERMVMDAMTKLAPAIAEEIIKSLKNKIDIIP